MRNKISLWDARDRSIVGPVDQFELDWLPTTGHKMTIAQEFNKTVEVWRVSYVEHILHFTTAEVFQQVDVFLVPDVPVR